MGYPYRLNLGIILREKKMTRLVGDPGGSLLCLRAIGLVAGWLGSALASLGAALTRRPLSTTGVENLDGTFLLARSPSRTAAVSPISCLMGISPSLWALCKSGVISNIFWPSPLDGPQGCLHSPGSSWMDRMRDGSSMRLWRVSISEIDRADVIVDSGSKPMDGLRNSY